MAIAPPMPGDRISDHKFFDLSVCMAAILSPAHAKEYRTSDYGVDLAVVGDPSPFPISAGQSPESVHRKQSNCGRHLFDTHEEVAPQFN